MKNSILLVGHFPPPTGGVAIHLQRLSSALKKENISVEALSFGKINYKNPEILTRFSNPMRFLIGLYSHYKLLHYHTDEKDWKSAILIGLWCVLRRQKFVITLHSFRSHPAFRFGFVTFLIRKIFAKSETLICVSDAVQNEMRDILNYYSQNTAVITPFLNISLEELDIDPNIENLQIPLNQDKIVIAFNASSIAQFDDVDLYGGDVLIDAFSKVSEEFLDTILVMVYSSGKPFFFDLVQNLNQNSPIRVIILPNFNGSFANILSHSHIFVRPTYADGAPLSVLEALSLGKFCIASDAVPRPKECILFKNRDSEDLARALRQTISAVLDGKKQMPIRFSTALEGLLPIYSKYLHKP